MKKLMFTCRVRFGFSQRLVGRGLSHSQDKRHAHGLRVQSPHELRRPDGRARREARHSASGRATNHHVYRLHHLGRLSRSGHPDVPTVSRPQGNSSRHVYIMA